MTGYRRVGAWAAVGVLACLWLPALPAQSGASSAAAALAQLLKPAPATQPGQSATLLPDGIWLLLGGQDGNGMPVPTALLVDLKTKRTVELLSGLSQARTAHSATLVPDGSVVVLGGTLADGTVADSAERFNPASESFELLPALGLIPRSQHTATLLSNGQLLIVGGVDGRNRPLYDVELFDTVTRKVESFNAKLESARLNDLAALLPSNAVLLWGGVDASGRPLPGAELYDPAQLRFVPYSMANALALAASLEHAGAPAVAASEPADGARSTSVDAMMSVRFSKRLDVTSLNAQTVVLMGAGGAVDVKVTPAETGVILFVTPARDLLPDSYYALFISGARDPLGQELPFTAIGFHTGAVAPTGFAQSNASGMGAPNATGVPAVSKGQDKAPAAKDTRPAPSGAGVNDDDEWIPSGANFKGDWRTGRARERALRTLPRRAEVLRAIHGIGGGEGSSLPPGVTAVAGQVLLINGRPLGNVTLIIGGQSAQTDANGEFLLTGVAPGGQTLVIDGGTASNPQKRYGRYEYRMNVRAGQFNALPFVIWMTRLDTGNAVRIASPTTSETVVTTPRIPGLELRIPSGKVIRDAAGKIVFEVSITAVPVDQPPFPLPNVPVPIYFTIQPGGAHLEDVAGTGAIGARLIYPNFTGSAPGSRMDFWNYDARDRGWYVYGQGSVSPDGRQTIPDPGVAIYEFTGAMIGGPGNAPAFGPPPGGCKEGDPVDCYTGLFLHERVDLRINDVVPIEIGRTYRPADSATRSFGIGAMLSYDLFLVGDAFPYTYQDLILPDGGRIHYVRTSTGTSYPDAVYQHTATPSRYQGSTLYWNGNGWDLKLKDGTTFKFIDSYQTTNFRKSAPIQIVDRFGNTVNLVRDANFNLTQVASPNGRSVFLTADGSGRITQVTDEIGRTVTYQYDTSGRLASVTDPAGGVEQYTYDTSHRMLTVRDKRNNLMVTNVYDANGRVATQTYADNTTNTFAYTLDGSGKVIQTDITDERAKVKRLAFNASGYPVTVTRALGQPEQQVIQNNVDATTNLLLSQTDALGRRTAYQYDSLGNLTRMTLLDGTANAVSVNYTYDPTFNQVRTVTDPLNHTTTYDYDALGNRIRATDPLSQITQMSYTPSGQLASVTDPLNHATSFAYTSGDLSTITDPFGRTVSFATDALGRVILVTDPLGSQSQSVYDALDRVVSRTDARGAQVAYAYDANSNLTSFTDARNNVTGFAYDVRNRVITKTDALLQAESYQYDAAGTLGFVTDRKGQVRGFTYDLLGRRTQAGFGATSTTSPVYTNTIGYTYDAANRVTQLTDSANGTITRQYDDRFNTLTQETTPQGTVTYVYDAAGQRSSMTPSGGTQVSYTYDAASRVTQITQGSSTIGFTYDTANRRTTLTLANGITLAYGYDNANELTGITYRDAANTLLGDLSYGYDNAGRRTSMGGSFARTGLPNAIASATYDANNRLTNWNGTTLSHDGNGNLLGFQGDTYSWNSRDQLASISGTNAASFTYDAVGRRQAKTVAGAATQFLYDGLNPVQERSGGSVTASLLTGLGIDEFFTRTEGANTQHYLTDALSSTIRLTDGTATKLVDYTYEPYGKASADASSTNAFQYTGRENDSTGLYYYRARYQHPVLGRFISEDPIGLVGGVNVYSYVNGDPISFIDPTGLVIMATIGPAMGFTLEESEQVSNVGNAAMEVAGTGAPVVAAAGVGIIASVDVLLSLTAQQLRELIAAGLIALSKEVGVASKAPSLPTQSRQAIQRIIQEIKSSSKMQPPSVTRKLPVAITGGIISSEEMYCRELQ